MGYAPHIELKAVTAGMVRVRSQRVIYKCSAGLQRRFGFELAPDAAQMYGRDA